MARLIGNCCKFLGELKIGKLGQAFILEPSDLLVASSTVEKPYEVDSDRKKNTEIAS